jgi:sigma-E factor negative regulatory protein RseA
MNKVNESFSAFIDGEASELDIQRLLKAMDETPSVIQDWHGLSKVQASMQNDVLVDAALTYTDVEELKTAPTKTGWGFRLFQGGIAAAVAMVVVTSVNMTMNDPASSEIAEVTVVPSGETNLAQQQFEAQQRLELFMREHAEQASFTTGHVVVSSELEWVEGAE